MQKLTITQLHLVGFGKFKDYTIDLKEGLNLIEGENEAGKSTLQAFITGMFYGFYQQGSKRRTHTSQWEQYKPWDGSPYRGVLLCQNEERSFRIERSFEQNSESVSVYDAVTGEDLTSTFPYNTVTRQAEVGEVLLGMSKTTFNNTANIAQMTCSSVSQEASFSAEVNDRLLSVMNTAEAKFSLSAVFSELDHRAEQTGSPKKSRTPYGKATLRERELIKELAFSKQNESEYLELLKESKEISAEMETLKKEKDELETQVRESAAKELGIRYLKAQNLSTRIERMERDSEKYSIYEDIDLEAVDKAQNCLGAKAQLGRTIEKYSRTNEEIAHRIGELDSFYQRLVVAGAPQEVLERFEQMQERYRNFAQLQTEVEQLRKQKEKADYYTGKVPVIDADRISADIEKLKQFDSKKSQPQVHKNGLGIALIICGVLLIVAGLVISSSVPIKAAIAISGACVAGLGAVMYIKTKKDSQQDNISQAEQTREQILKIYHLAEEENPISRLEEMLGKVQVNNYKLQKLKEQAQALGVEISEKSKRVQEMQESLTDYLAKLTQQKSGEEKITLKLEIMVDKSLGGQVQQAKRILAELDRLYLQQEQIQAEREGAETQLASINETIETAIQSCSKAGAKTVEDLEVCRRGNQRYREVSRELSLQKELLAETLGEYTFEELRQNIRSQKSSETEISPDRQEICHKLNEVRDRLSERSSKLAELQGLRQGREENCRPVGQIEAELAQVREECKDYQLELDAIALAKERLISLSGQLHRDFAPLLNDKISKAIERVTDSRYTKAVVDQSLGIRLEDKQSGKLVEVSSLSSGTADLVYLVMRRELLRVLAEQGEGQVAVPLLFDDSFTQLDDERTARFLSFLLSEQQEQIFLFSCHSREKLILDKAGIPYHFVKLKRSKAVKETENAD